MLQAGFSRADVTAPLGSYLAGYYHERYAEGVLDPIELNAIALSDGENKAVIIVSDFQGIRKAWADPIREKISERTGLNINSITISSLHQHTSVALRPGKANNVINDNAYLDFLYRKFCDVAVMALDDLSDAVMTIGEEETAEQISFIRRYKLKDGTYKTNPFNVEDRILEPAEKPDNTVRLIRFKRENKKDIALVNFACHPDVAGGLKFTADWCGFVRKFVESDNEDVSCVLVNGFQGDSNHINFMGEKKRGLERAIEMGRIIADTVKKIWDKGEKIEETEVSSYVDVAYSPTSQDKIEFYEECKKLYKEKPGQANEKTESGIAYSEAGRIISTVESAPLIQKIPITAITVGKVVLVGIGCEPFTNYGANIRKKFPDKFILTSCCMNGHEGYLPTKVSFEQGGYEAITSPYTPQVEEDCMKVIEKLIER